MGACMLRVFHILLPTDGLLRCALADQLCSLQKPDIIPES